MKHFRELNIAGSEMPVQAVLADIAKKNAQNESLWSRSYKADATRLAGALEEAYPRSRIFITYRQKFIAVKVETPHCADMISKEAVAVDRYADSNGYKKVVTKKGIIFRVK